MTHTILAIDGKKEAWSRLKPHLESKGYRFLFARDIDEGLRQFKVDSVNLVLINEGITGTDYLDIIRSIKSSHVVPIIVLSERDRSADKVTPLELGADDFLSTPFELDELTARIGAHLRLIDEVRSVVKEKLSENGISAIHFGDWCLDLKRHELLDKDSKPIELTNGEFQLLETLARSPRVALSRDQLFEQTRGQNADGMDRSVDVQISRIRQKLGDDQSSNTLIRTIRGVGYMLDIDTEVFSD